MTIRSLTFAIAGLFIVLAQAAPLPTTGKAVPPEDLKAAVQRQLESREALQRKADEAQTALRAWYQAALDAVKKDAIGKGDLDGVVAVDAERDRVERDLTEAEKDALPKVPRSVRDKYDEARALQAKQLSGAVLASLRSYATLLEGLEKKLTQQGKLDDAVATRLERAKVSTLLAGGEVAPVSPPVAPEPARPAPAPAAPPAPKPAAAPPAPASVAAIQGISRENPAKIEVENLSPKAIVEEGASDPEPWASFPPEFATATIFYPKKVKEDQSTAAVNFKTISPGRVYVVVNFVSQGGGGSWLSDRWTEAQFIEHGWSRVEGAEFIGVKGRKEMVLTKVLEKDESGRLRCNKYHPPYLVTFAPAGS